MKQFWLLCLFIICGTIADAQMYRIQKGSEISVGISGMQPLGSFHTNYNLGFGFDLKYAYNFNETLAATVSAGYNYFGSNSIGGIGFHYFPLKLGARYTRQIFYIEPQLGVATTKTGGVYDAVKTCFLYAVQIGIIPIKNLDVSLRYEGCKPDIVSYSYNNDGYYSNSFYINTFSLRVACRLPFNNK